MTRCRFPTLWVSYHHVPGGEKPSRGYRHNSCNHLPYIHTSSRWQSEWRLWMSPSDGDAAADDSLTSHYRWLHWPRVQEGSGCQAKASKLTINMCRHHGQQRTDGVVRRSCSTDIFLMRCKCSGWAEVRKRWGCHWFDSPVSDPRCPPCILTNPEEVMQPPHKRCPSKFIAAAVNCSCLLDRCVRWQPASADSL